MSLIVLDEATRAGVKGAIERWVATERAAPSTTELVDLYETAVTIFAVSNFRAENVAQIGMRILSPDGAELPQGDPRAGLFQRRFYDAMLRTELTLFFWGKNLLVKKRNAYRQWVGLRWLNPHLWDRDVHTADGLRGFQIYHAGTSFERAPAGYISMADAIYMHEVDFNDDFDGVSPAEACFSFAGVEEEAAQTMLHFFRNRAIPALLLQPAADAGGTHMPDEPAKNRLVAFFRQMVQGARNAGRTVIDWKRWEAILLQQEFDKAAAPESTHEARQAVSLAARVPLSLLLSDEENYAAAYDKRLGWKESWLMPRCRRYASYFSEAVEAEIGAGWRVEPDFDDTLKELAARQTDLARQQTEGTLITLYDAQKMIGVAEPDERLKDLYLVRGMPVPAEQLRTLYERERPALTLPPEEEGAAPALPPTLAAMARDGEVEGPLPPRPETPIAGQKTAGTDHLGPGFLIPFVEAAERAQLASLRDQAARAVWPGEGVEWVEPDDWHLSLCYAGQPVEPARVAEFFAFPELERWPAFYVAVTGLAIWDTPNGPCLVAQVTLSAELARLQATICARFAERGIIVVEHSTPGSYTAHVTLAYGGPRDAALSGPFAPLLLLVDRVALVESDRTLFTWELPAARSPADAGRADEGAKTDGAEMESLEIDARALDAALDELAVWRKRAGKNRADGFENRALPADTAAYVRLLLGTGDADAFSLGRKHYVEHHAMPIKAYNETAMRYRAALYDLIASAFRAHPETGKPAVGRQEFGEKGRAEISAAFRAAFFDGLRAGGVDAEALDEDEETELEAEIKAERGYWTALANELYRNALPKRQYALQVLLNAEARRDPEERARLRGRADEIYAEFQRARDDFLRRIDLWVNKGLKRIFDSAKLFAEGNMMKRWVLGQTEQHCRTCLAANGQVHRAKDWRRKRILPRTDVLECGGFECDCELVDAPGEKAQGRLDRIPLVEGGKGAHEHEHVETEATPA